MAKRNRKNIRDTVARRLLKLDSNELCEAVRRRTGLSDFGDPPLEPALSVLSKSLDEEADLHPLGRLLIRIHLRDLLATRLRLVESWRGKAERMSAIRIKR